MFVLIALSFLGGVRCWLPGIGLAVCRDGLMKSVLPAVRRGAS